jgi:hypothetical protein
MKKLFSVAIMALFANMAFAADASCEAKAAERNWLVQPKLISRQNVKRMRLQPAHQAVQSRLPTRNWLVQLKAFMTKCERCCCRRYAKL